MSFVKCAEYAARPAQLEECLHELKGKLDFSDRRNDVADLRYSMLSDECDFLKLQIISYEMCSGEIVRRLSNVFKNVDVLIDDLSYHAANAQNAV